MNAAELETEISRVAPELRSRVPVLFHVPAVWLEAGDKLPTTATYDADGSLVIEVDTSNVFLFRVSVSAERTRDAVLDALRNLTEYVWEHRAKLAEIDSRYLEVFTQAREALDVAADAAGKGGST